MGESMGMRKNDPIRGRSYTVRYIVATARAVQSSILALKEEKELTQRGMELAMEKRIYGPRRRLSVLFQPLPRKWRHARCKSI